MKSSKNNKQPKSQEVFTSKTPKSRPQQQVDTVVWSFVLLEEEGPFGWNHCTSHEKYFKILIKKKHLGNMECWSDIEKAGSHAISCDKLCKEARDRLKEIKQDDIEELFSVRISGEERIFCIRDGNCLKVLWWDPNHQVCPSRLKHT